MCCRSPWTAVSARSAPSTNPSGTSPACRPPISAATCALREFRPQTEPIHIKHGDVPMAGRLAGKIAIISGGATGMGGAASKLFAAEGAKVGVVDRNEEAGLAVVAEIAAAA